MTSDDLRRELEVREAEEAFAAAKAEHDRDSAAYRKAKDRMNAARLDYRRARPDGGATVATPDTIKATAGEKK